MGRFCRTRLFCRSAMARERCLLARASKVSDHRPTARPVQRAKRELWASRRMMAYYIARLGFYFQFQSSACQHFRQCLPDSAKHSLSPYVPKGDNQLRPLSPTEIFCMVSLRCFHPMGFRFESKSGQGFLALPANLVVNLRLPESKDRLSRLPPGIRAARLSYWRWWSR